MGWHGLLITSVIYFNFFVLGYFILLNGSYFVLFVASLAEVSRVLRRRFQSDYQQILISDMTLPVTILVPAHNEEKTIVATVRSLLMLNYGQFEIIVVNDGSTDATLQWLVDAFELRRMDKVYRRSIPTRAIRGVYGSLVLGNLLVVDKVQGGKADALNAGINLSRYPLFCSVDADSVLEEDALLKVVKPFLEHPDEMVAVGGIVRCVNGCEVTEGRVTKVRLPREALPTLQVVEYLRAFLAGRIGWSVMRSLLIISGAFGLYKKAEVIEVGGYDHYTDTEDLELVVQLHRSLRRKKKRYRIVFVPDPVCWTEVPSTWKILFRQRNRWHRGMLQTFARHKRMFFNPRFGPIGVFAFPYYLFFETMGPFIEVLGYIAVVLSYFLGILNFEFFLLFFVLAVMYGIFLSVAAILLEEISFRRYPRWEDLMRLLLYGIVENFGYRQVLALFKVKAFYDFLRRRRMWGEMDREGFQPPMRAPVGSPVATGP